MRLLALVDSPDHVCCRYRIRAFEPALTRAGWSLACQGLERGIRSPDSAQLAQAAGYDVRDPPAQAAAPVAACDPPAARAPAGLRLRRRRALPRFVRPPRALIRPGAQRRFAATVRCADAVIAGNDFLADCALAGRGPAPSASGRSPPASIRDCIPSDQPRSAAENAGDGRRPGLDRLVEHAPGAGSSSEPLWDRLGEEIPGLRLRVICDRFPELFRRCRWSRSPGPRSGRRATWRPGRSASAGCPTTPGAGASAG